MTGTVPVHFQVDAIAHGVHGEVKEALLRHFEGITLMTDGTVAIHWKGPRTVTVTFDGAELYSMPVMVAGRHGHPPMVLVKSRTDVDENGIPLGAIPCIAAPASAAPPRAVSPKPKKRAKRRR